MCSLLWRTMVSPRPVLYLSIVIIKCLAFAAEVSSRGEYDMAVGLENSGRRPNKFVLCRRTGACSLQTGVMWSLCERPS